MPVQGVWGCGCSSCTHSFPVSPATSWEAAAVCTNSLSLMSLWAAWLVPRSPVHLHCSLTTWVCRTLGHMICWLRFELACTRARPLVLCLVHTPSNGPSSLASLTVPRSSRLQPHLPPSSPGSDFCLVLEMLSLAQPLHQTPPHYFCPSRLL